MKIKVLIVGPSPDRSKGGMATVIDEIRNDEKLSREFDICIHESYIDGNFLTRLCYSFYALLKFYIVDRNYDIYHIHMAANGSTFRKGYYTRAARRWGKKVILHIHAADYMQFYDALPDKKKKKVISILNFADLVIALSPGWKEKFDNTFAINNCVVLENGINIDRLRPAITDPLQHNKEFLCLGQLGKRKGSYDLVKAIKIVKETIPDIKLYLAGDGEVEQVLEEIKLAGLENNIEIVGWADFNKKLELLKNISTVTLPSYNEGLPMSILEGMACGKAIVSSTVGAIPEVVKEENGILIKPGDIEALANALLRCATDIDMLNSMQKHNLKLARDAFDMKIMHERLKNYYYKVIINNEGIEC